MPRERTILYRHFSPETNRLYVLYQEPGDIPNLEISGIKMKSSKPGIKTILAASLAALRPLVGVCLDTCGGLGYSAIALAAIPGVQRVVCFEIDRNVVEAARHNPQATSLFDNPRIDLRLEDVSKGIAGLPDATFDRVFHDPPRQAMAGELYALDFYRELIRVMKPGAKLFHYTGTPGEKRGKDVRGGVIRRLHEAGFAGVRDLAAAQGVFAIRPGRVRL